MVSGRPSETLGFALRLFLALCAALVLVGVVAYGFISQELEANQLESFAASQKADVVGFEEAARTYDRRTAIREIDELLDAMGRRPGRREANLVAPNGEIVASSEERLTGTVDVAPQIRAAIERGETRYGHEIDQDEPGSDFEFVTPVEFPQGRYALEVDLNSQTLTRQLASVRHVLVLVGLGALFGVSLLFYLLGGRSLLGSHRLALHRATLDGLTDLPNQRAFEADFMQAAALADRDKRPLSLAVLDVDRFKLVNDRHGHPAGDKLLRTIASTLRQGRASDRAFRIGGDEFALLLPNTDVAGARTVVRRLTRVLSKADAAVSMGVATIHSGEPSRELRAEADAALYEAKRRGGRRAVHFHEIRGEVTVSTSGKREALRRMIDEGGIATALQPIWDLRSEQIIGIEALTRPDERYGFAGPAEAFAVAASAGLVHELDELCAAAALETAASHELPAGAALFLNISPKTLEVDAGAVDWLTTAVEMTELPPERVVIEVTEQMGSRVAPVVRSLEELRSLGFKIALDDVGTGNAGLEMMRKLDADFVKIDRSIVVAAPTDPKARGVLMAMATYSLQTGAFVIAEGIEDEQTLAFVRSLEEIDLRPGRMIQGGQGYKLGRPVADVPDPFAEVPADI
jgi:diguanylate cyclase (GGDEF)-like protein